MTTDVEPPATDMPERVASELARQLGQPLEPGLFLVPTPIGNLGDMTLRAIAVLAGVDLIYCEDTRHSRVLLDHFGIRKPVRPYHEHNAATERPRILAALADGRRIAMITDAGTPLISDPGYKIVREAIEQGARIEALPGASAVLTGLTAAGLPTDCFLFAGFLPAKDQARRSRLAELADVPGTLVFFESPGRLAASLGAMAEVFGSRETAVARELTKRFEEVRRGTAVELAAWARAGEIKGEIVILVGPPAAREVTDEDINTGLEMALQEMSLRDAARAVADDLNVTRSRVYDLGLKLKAGRS
ncbi:MAG: 16S rRNA (cytidine(1402)-2'-O)-methyltransferase [Hyphomicrobiaceae bacterium]